VIGLSLPAGPLSVVCIGAHPDDIEIGCGATLLSLAARGDVTVSSLVLTGTPERAAEARHAASAFCPGGTIEVAEFDDGRLPERWGDVKRAVHDFRDRTAPPDIVFAPRAGDAHQDHALLGTMAPTVWRDALVLAYEVPKWDGDPVSPNVYLAIDPRTARRKVALLHESFPSQSPHDWWDDEVFLGLMRLRGMECRSTYAEAFELHKGLIAL
jgi:LmbE family N-acetylglucosaminyl deacetylase